MSPLINLYPQYAAIIRNEITASGAAPPNTKRIINTRPNNEITEAILSFLFILRVLALLELSLFKCDLVFDHVQDLKR